MNNSIDALLELVAAYCVGEVELSSDDLSSLATSRSIPAYTQEPQEKRQNESAD
jgi:hypothetical protein